MNQRKNVKKRTQRSIKVNKKYKDTLFKTLFGKESVAAEVYNAIESTNYGPEAVSMVTLENTLYITPVNDVAFTIDNKFVVLIEHQSTINENMPLRMLLYIAMCYIQLTDDVDIYGRTRKTIPRPEFIVLYNGKEERPDVEVLKLSDMFAACDMEYPINLELIVRVYNINKDHNPEMARKSVTLNGYEVFTAKVREYEKMMPFEQVFARATDECIKDGFLADFLTLNRKAVQNMLTAEWDSEVQERVIREDERLAERLTIARRLKAKGMSVDEIIELTELSVDNVLKA
jgi:predicted transposase/invertase (TIGR01784 family)